MRIVSHPSPNFGERRGGAKPSLIVLHYTAMTSVPAALERLCAPDFEVSAHYLIAEDGRIYRLVEEEFRAWHAGAGTWGGVSDVNSASIGIELANPGNAPYAAPLMAALESLLADLMARHGIPAERVIGHSDMAPARKRDPGPRFDWRRLARAGLSVWPEMRLGADPDPASVAEDLRAFGYPRDADAETAIAAFRLRFRPLARGGVSAEDAGLAADLARRWPVDRAASVA